MSLLIQYLSLCWFRNNPIDLHPTKSFMWKTVIFYIIIGIIVEGLIADFADGTLEVLLRTVMAFSTIICLLLFIGKREYFFQLFTAIFVCENFIFVLATLTEGMYFWMVMNHKELAEEISIGAGIFLLLWYLAIVSYIIRQVFEYRLGRSMIAAFSYFVLTYGVPMMFMDL